MNTLFFFFFFFLLLLVQGERFGVVFANGPNLRVKDLRLRCPLIVEPLVANPVGFQIRLS
jgi:hypothetical protein